MVRVITIIAFCAVSVFSQTRPADQWIHRGVMKDKGRVLFIALANQLTVTYEMSSAGLYMAWDGGLQDGNALYDHGNKGNHGATFDPQGNILFWQHTQGTVSSTPIPESRPKKHECFNNPGVVVWSVRNGNTNVPVEINYMGHSINNTAKTAALNYQLVTSLGTITVRESPEYSNAGGDINLVRVFNITGIPAGMSVTLKLDGSNVQGVTNSWAVSGTGTLSGNNMVQTTSGATTVTGTWR